MNQAVLRRLANAPPGYVDDALQGKIVGRVDQHAQVRHQVLDLAALVEAHAAYDRVRDALAAQRLFEHA